MFKALWTAILGGSPTSWLIMGVAAVAYTAAVFASGYVTATHSALKIEAAAPLKAAKAQEDHDKKGHVAAVAVSDKVAKADDARDAKLHVIVTTIASAEPPQNSCDLPVAVAEQLNRAGDPAQ